MAAVVWSSLAAYCVLTETHGDLGQTSTMSGTSRSECRQARNLAYWPLLAALLPVYLALSEKWPARTRSA